MKKCAVWSIIFLTTRLVLGQQVPDREAALQGLENDFLLRVYETAEGLLPTQARAIAQTADGYIWLAAFEGVVRFDGSRAFIFSGKNTPVLPVPVRTETVFADRNSRLWTATDDGRLFCYDEITWIEYGQRDGWPNLLVTSIAEAPDGTMFFGGPKKLMSLAHGKFAEVALPAPEDAAATPLKIFFDHQSQLWLATAHGVWWRDGEHWQRLDAAGAQIRGAAPCKSDGLWIANATAIRKFVNGQPMATHAREADFRNEEVQLLEDYRGNLWAGGVVNGLRVWMTDGRVLNVGGNSGLLKPQIMCLFEDREHNVLLATRGAGLGRIKPRQFDVTLGLLGGLVGTLINAVCEEKNGTLLFGTEGNGLHRINQAGSSIVTGSGLTPKSRITALLRLRDGSVIAAVPPDGLVLIRGDNLVALKTPLLAKKSVRALFEDSRGRVWLGYDDGVAIMRDGQFEPFGDAAKPLPPNVRAVVEDHVGTIWILGQKALVRVTGDRVEPVPLAGVPPKANLLALYASSDGSIWIAAESLGLVRYWQGQVFIYGDRYRLPVLSAGAIIEEDGWLWLAGEKGLARVSCRSLDGILINHQANLEYQFFNRGDGLPSDAFRRGYQNCAIQASDGRLWFATHKGAIGVRPASIVTAARETAAIIEEIHTEKQTIPVTRANCNRIELPAGSRFVTIRCTVPTLGKPEFVRFQYRLEGPAGVTSDIGTERVLRFNDWQPGRYRLQIWALGTDGRTVEPATSVAMIVLPFYWQTLWFHVLAVFSLVVFSGVIVWRIQQKRIQHRDEKLQEHAERAKLVEQLHQSQRLEAIGRLAGGIAHDFNNLLTIIIGNLGILRFGLPSDSNLHAMLEDIQKASERARDLVNQILTFSRQRPTERAVVDIAPSLHEACKLLRSGMPSSTEIKEDIPASLPPILADLTQIHRIVMNLGTNAAYAVAAINGCIQIKAESFVADQLFCRQNPKLTPGNYVRLTVADNGHGMDDQTLMHIFDPFYTTKAVGKGTGLGLSVVHGIVETHDAHIIVCSAPGAGTTFQVYFPVSSKPVETPPTEKKALPKGENETILLVDDDPAVVNTTRAMLEKIGYRVETTTDPHEAAAMVVGAPAHFQLVVTDFAMPKITGVELARLVWAVTPELPIILFSGYGGSIDEDAAREMGFVKLLNKPFSVQVLADAVSLALAKPRREVK